jgi:hypothetical protein
MSEEAAVNLNGQERLKSLAVIRRLTKELLAGRLSAYELEFKPPLKLYDYEFDGLLKGYQKIGLLTAYTYDARYYTYISCETAGSTAGKHHKVERIIEVAYKSNYNGAGHDVYHILKVHGFTYDAGERCEDNGE